ncbi:menaquinol-cytochrome c reductase cytochrome b subunit precursor [Thermomonospora umbrina]|uniref:Cytochrome bc1 complex cytochrome b subunit n=1 Tax=Thermomonospora umbrina TaxID=111806 RepID=A0A3D9SY07_9ACTN|nr:cytochrome bc complex cytochrome b subunit [Thermomonospora umbrina]REE97444.1 menaquinol-cytochrome c reductase cytochrome b subunit precursor [Thermomonospora umbrina]
MTTPRRPGRTPRALGATGRAIDDRFGGAKFGAKAIKKAFPDHWSFLLGEIALYSFVIILLTGVFLTLFFKPSATQMIYEGSYAKLRGVQMSEAYASTLHISFDIRGGLLVRQIHHWATVLFLAAILIHMLRNFFTGAFRKPRELNWLIGVTLFILVLLNGLFGYSLPDDLLSGTGLRILEGVLLGLPLVGSYATMFLFGGEFPGEEIIPRLFSIHVLLIPGILAALIPLHAVVLTWHQTHTQFPGRGSSNETQKGYPFFPVFVGKTVAYQLWTFAVIILLATFAQVNPVWLYGPYDPGAISAGSQPDWYMGFLEGSLRLMPNWEFNLWGYTFPMNVLIPALVVPGVLFTGLAVYPFLERWVTGDHATHHLLDRPRDVPVRTGIGVAGMVFYGLLWIAGANDIIAHTFHIPLFATTWFFRIAIFVGPVIGFIVAQRMCLGLQRRDRFLLEHGLETGVIMLAPDGRYSELEVHLSKEAAAPLTDERLPTALPLGRPDREGIAPPEARGRMSRVRLGLNRWFIRDLREPVSPHGDGESRHHEEQTPSLEK